MKTRCTAKAVACAWEIVCPTCQETVPAPKGSLFWVAEDFLGLKAIKCTSCGTTQRVPAALKDRNIP